MSGPSRSAPPSAASGGGGHLGEWKTLASGTAVKAGQTVTHKGGLYSRIADGTIGTYFVCGAWKLLQQTLPPVSQRGRVLTFKSDTRMGPDNAGSTLGTQFIQPETIVRDTDGTYYCTCTYTTLAGVVTAGWMRCLAGLDPRDGGNWTEVGPISLSPTPGGNHVDAPFPFRLGSAWYMLIGGKGTGFGTRLYKSTTGILGTYTNVVVADGELIPVGAAATWNAARIDEPCYHRRADGSHVILAMGFDTGNVHEQIGAWTCPAGSSIETPANWTPLAGNPIIPNGAAGSDDEQVIADPYIIEVDGTAWIAYYGVAANGVSVAARHSEMFVTTTDWVTFTKRGTLLEDFALYSGEPVPPNTINGLDRLGHNWRGHWHRLGPEYDNDVLWPYGANWGGVTASNRRIQGRLAVIPLECFRSVPVKQPWIRIQSDATDSRINRTGTGWTLNSNTGYQGGTAYFSSVAGDRFQFFFNGIGCRVRGQMRQTNGIANVWLDGVKVATIDLYQLGDTANSLWSVPFVDRDDLPAGEHLVEIEVTGTKNASSTGTSVLVDYVEYLPGHGS